MKREKGNYKLPIPLTTGEVRVFSFQGNLPHIIINDKFILTN